MKKLYIMAALALIMTIVALPKVHAKGSHDVCMGLAQAGFTAQAMRQEGRTAADIMQSAKDLMREYVEDIPEAYRIAFIKAVESALKHDAKTTPQDVGQGIYDSCTRYSV